MNDDTITNIFIAYLLSFFALYTDFISSSILAQRVIFILDFCFRLMVKELINFFF